MPRAKRMIPTASRLVAAAGILMLGIGCGVVGNNHEARLATVYQPEADIRVVPRVAVWQDPEPQDAASLFRHTAEKRAVERGIMLVWSASADIRRATKGMAGNGPDAVVFIAPMSQTAQDAAAEALKHAVPVFVVGADSRGIAATCRLMPADHAETAQDAALAVMLVDAVADYVRGVKVPTVIRVSERTRRPTGPMPNRE